MPIPHPKQSYRDGLPSLSLSLSAQRLDFWPHLHCTSSRISLTHRRVNRRLCFTSFLHPIVNTLLSIP